MLAFATISAFDNGIIQVWADETDTTDDANAAVFTSGEFDYKLNEDGTAQITGFHCEVGAELDSLVIPEELDGITVTGIDGGTITAFSVNEVFIPKSVTEMDENPFWKCRVKRFTVDPQNPRIRTEAGILYSADDRRLISYPAGVEATEYQVPNGIETIGDSAFRACNKLVTVSLPNSVTSIGNYAFADAMSLENINFTANLREIGDYAFENVRIKTVYLQEGVERIGDEAFYMSDVVTAYIPDSVEQIGRNPFGCCYNLREFSLVADNKRFVCINNALFSVEDKRLICCADRENTGVYEIPDGIEIVDEYAFFSCAFTGIKLPEGLVEIGDNAFLSCGAITTFELPQSLKKIGSSAFRSDFSLASIRIPAGVTEIGTGLFQYCNALASVEVEPENVAYESIDGVLFSKNERKLVSYPPARAVQDYVVPEGTVEICDEAILGVYALRSIYLPDGLRRIGKTAFAADEQLDSIRIPESTTSIDEWAFDCIGEGVLTVVPDSYAQEYAQEHHMPFTY